MSVAHGHDVMQAAALCMKCNGSHRSGVLKIPVRDYNQLEQCGKYSHHLKHDFRIAKHEADLLADELSAFQSLFEIFSHISHPLEVKVMKLLVSNYRKKFPIPKQNFASKRGMDGVSQSKYAPMPSFDNSELRS
ncbi:hypothetical protein E8E15_000124 [Penicillium rubens]|nr:hypothetical protein E8E15_000124 [Penicillium rubens]